MKDSDQLAIPISLRAAAESQGREAWLATLRRTVHHLEQVWSIEVGEPFQPGGQTAWVAPASRGEDDLVVKVLWRHPEAEYEADGLALWDGDGAVALHAAEVVDAETKALLIERCRPGTTLKSRPEPEQDLVLTGLLRRLWKTPPAGHGFPALQSMCELWADGFETKTAAGGSGLDPGLAREGIALFRQLPSSAERSVMLCTDLHADNVLASGREPWLVIDPKPFVGDPTYDALQHMLNCDGRLHADPVGLIRRMASLLGLDADRLRLWLFARCVQESPEWPDLAKVARQLAP